MERKRFSVERIVAVLKQAEAGMRVPKPFRQIGIIGRTFYRWKKQYAGLPTDQVWQLELLRDENVRPKNLVADLTLDKAMLTDVLQKSDRALAEAAHRGSSEMQPPGKRAPCAPAAMVRTHVISRPQSP